MHSVNLVVYFDQRRGALHAVLKSSLWCFHIIFDQKVEKTSYLYTQMTVTLVRLTVLHVGYQHSYMTVTDIGNQLHILTTF